MTTHSKAPIARRFRGFLPVVVDLETGGFNSDTDAILEMAVIMIDMEEDGRVFKGERLSYAIAPFEGANIEKSALEFTGIDAHNPARLAHEERDAFGHTFRSVRKRIKETGCTRAIMVAHNAAFDLKFLYQAALRNNLKRNPFHPFSTLDTASLAGLAFGQTVLSRACASAGIAYSKEDAHSAIYDCDRTAELFCYIVNRWHDLGGMSFD